MNDCRNCKFFDADEYSQQCRGCDELSDRWEPLDREALGRMVRAAWVRWAEKCGSPKDSWLLPWEKLSEFDKEADRQIGEALANALRPASPPSPAPPSSWPAVLNCSCSGCHPHPAPERAAEVTCKSNVIIAQQKELLALRRAVAEAAAAEVVTWSKGCDSCPHNHGIDCESAPGCLVMENLRSALAALPAKESARLLVMVERLVSAMRRWGAEEDCELLKSARSSEVAPALSPAPAPGESSK